MILVSSAQVWLSRELADHVRAVLEPLVVQYHVLASQVGSDPARQAERAHHVGRAQGLIDAIAALGLPAAAPEPGQVTDDVLRRIRKNRGAHRSKP